MFVLPEIRAALSVLLLIQLAAESLWANELTLISHQSPRPNVVFILADDLGWGEVGCFGQSKIPTPNIDRLASRGVKLTRHYSGAPTCAPSRCVLMTGKHLGHAEIRGNQQAKVKLPQFTEGQHPLSDKALTIARQFQKAGYATGAFGKWGLGPVGSTGEPNRQGFDEFFGYNCQALAHSYFPKALWKNAESIVNNEKPVPGHKKQPEGEVTMEAYQGENYAPRLIMAEALSFIDRHHQQPFFLYLPFTEPHVAMQPPPKIVEEFPVEWDERVYRGDGGYLPHPRPRAAYAAMIRDLDNHVGDVITSLEKHGLLEKTLIVFTSDNGATHASANPDFHVGGADPLFFNSTRELKGFKGSIYEGGLRVPAIVSWPGQIPPATTINTPSYFPDWFPTLCNATQLPLPEGLDGVNLLPLLTGKTSPDQFIRPDPMVWVYAEYTGQVCVHLGDFKVLRRGLRTNRPGPWEVYQLVSDPGESTNLADSRPDLVTKAIEVLKAQTAPNEIFPMPECDLPVLEKGAPKAKTQGKNRSKQESGATE
ncbi:sulfatase [Planctopirus limnophila DSM 3776]|uniref:Sulfatase n=1 Tax=Planctopirus limnophila (strain ATCC 43296 / DSM 3776 / IFAM 1008 / Mu 290) TaxID=521674 RepID=D5SW45_PLAL2|nr:arylsulfatase [Planctopirus limnophila]ADG67330.1 sulfatase [Planctopirus limnophila DSM 3776]